MSGLKEGKKKKERKKGKRIRDVHRRQTFVQIHSRDNWLSNKIFSRLFSILSFVSSLHFIPLSTILCRVLLDRRSNQHLPWLMVYAYRTSGKHRDFSYTLMNYLTSSPGASWKLIVILSNRARALGHDFATLDARKIKFHYRLIALDRVITKWKRSRCRDTDSTKFSPARKNSSRSLEFLFNFIRVCAKRSRFNTLSPSIFHSICIEPFRNIREYFRIFRRIICLKNFIPN